jgi:hypothetical protein
LRRDFPASARAIAAQLRVLHQKVLIEMQQRQIELTDKGRIVLRQLVDARSQALAEILAGWSPEEEPEVRALLERLAQAFVSEMPAPVPPGVETGERLPGSGKLG